MSASHLTLAYWCVLVAAALPYLSIWLARAGVFGLSHNKAPRDWVATQQGWRARAHAAQYNGFEGLPLFIGAVVAAHQFGAAQGRLDALALAYVVLRVVYAGLYIAGAGAPRSIVWSLGFLVSMAIFFIAP